MSWPEGCSREVEPGDFLELFFGLAIALISACCYFIRARLLAVTVITRITSTDDLVGLLLCPPLVYLLAEKSALMFLRVYFYEASSSGSNGRRLQTTDTSQRRFDICLVHLFFCLLCLSVPRVVSMFFRFSFWLRARLDVICC